MQAVKPNQDDLNKLIMNYLIVEGYKGGALKFEKESGIKGKFWQINLQLSWMKIWLIKG